MQETLEQKLLQACSSCHGERLIDCCNGHMCPGYRECPVCRGTGKEIKPEVVEILRPYKRCL